MYHSLESRDRARERQGQIATIMAANQQRLAIRVPSMLSVTCLPSRSALVTTATSRLIHTCTI